MSIEITPVGRDVLKAAVEKGYAWLLESGPQCGLDVRRLDTDILDVSSSCRCVLGQLGGAGYFEITLDDIAATMEFAGGIDFSTKWAQEHGFLVAMQATAPSVPNMTEYWKLGDTERFRINLALDDAYRLLTNVWREVIAERAQEDS